MPLSGPSLYMLDIHGLTGSANSHKADWPSIAILSLCLESAQFQIMHVKGNNENDLMVVELSGITVEINDDFQSSRINNQSFHYYPCKIVFHVSYNMCNLYPYLVNRNCFSNLGFKLRLHQNSKSC